MRQWSGRASLGRFLVLASFVIGAGCVAPSEEAGGPRRVGQVDAFASQTDSASAETSTGVAFEPASATNVKQETEVPKGPRLFAYEGNERIYQKPDSDSPLIGLVRAGQGVPLMTGEPLKGPGIGRCNGGSFYAVKPRGFICSGKHSTLDGDDVRVRAAAEFLPDIEVPMPYRVGILNSDSPQYQRIPTKAEQKSNEPGLEDHLAKFAAGTVVIPKNAGGTFDTKKAGHGPSANFTKYLEVMKPKLIAEEEAYEGRKMAFAGEFDAEGRTWLVTPDLTLVPKDKVRFVEGSALKGLDLRKEEWRFPFGYTWIENAAKLKKHEDGSMVETGEVYPFHSFVQLEGNVVRGKKGGNYWKTSDGTYIRHELVSVFKKRTDRPAGVGAKDKWIDVRVTWGTLVAYEGSTPVYATAVSPGVDGITERAHGHTTKRGTFPVGWKIISADMNGVEKGKPWAVDEVPFVAYYKDSYAVHTAWWHDDFGRPKSHGCVNAAPYDAHWLWKWMDPVLPEGWYAVSFYRPDVKSSTIVVRP